MSEKQGDLVKCPACGALISAMATQCDSCGYEFRNVKANSSVVDLSNRIEAVYRECDEIYARGGYKTSSSTFEKYLTNRLDETEEDLKNRDINKKLNSVISNFPVPQTREDILELLHFIQPKIQLGAITDNNSLAWRKKYQEIIARAKTAYANDPKMLSELSVYENQTKKNLFFAKFISLFGSLPPAIKKPLIGLLIIGVIGIVIVLMEGIGSGGHDKNVKQEKARLEQQLEKINDAIDDENYKKALRLCTDLYWEYEDSYKHSDTDLLKEQWTKKHDEMVNFIEEQMR